MDPRKTAGIAAAKLVKNGMKLGLGTGVTVTYFLEELAISIKGGLKVSGIPTSIDTEIKCKDLGIPILNGIENSSLDLAIDGCDAFDDQFLILKGSKGALTREKIVAYSAEKFVVITELNRKVNSISEKPFFVEVLPFWKDRTIACLQKTFSEIQLMTTDGRNFITDNGNLLFECYLNRTKIMFEEAMDLEKTIASIPGVIQSGLFTNRPAMIIAGTETDAIYFS